MDGKIASFFTIKELGILLSATLILIIPALYNGFPIVVGDSGAYINNAFELYVPLDRPLSYSLFLRLASLGHTLWGTVAAQGLIVAFFLRLLCRHYLGAAYRNGVFLAIVLLISVISGAAWFCSQLMPDIFTAILLLALLTWYTVPLTAGWEKAALALFILCVLMQHNSHALILLLFSGVLMLLAWRRKRAWLMKSAGLFVLGIIALLGFSTMNAISGKGFRPSAASGVFLMCRLVESGVMDKFLAENCADNQYNLCPYRDELPYRQWGFMWDANSPLTKTGGWEANEEQYKQIEKKILTTPKYLMLFLFKSGQATLRQLPQIYLGDGTITQLEGSAPYGSIKTRFPYELKEYRAAQQNDASLPLPLFNGLIVFGTLVLLIVSLFVAAYSGHYNGPWKGAFSIIIFFLFCNAAVTATFSTVLGRFEARVFWVLPFFCVLFLLRALLRKLSFKNAEGERLLGSSY